MAYLNVVKVTEALVQMRAKFNGITQTEQIPLEAAAGRILAQDLWSGENLPAFRRSMVDGYAVKTVDVNGASEQAPVPLTCLAAVQMGETAKVEVVSGTAVYVPTGGDLPTGADAMVMVEHTEPFGPDIAVLTTPRHGEHVVAIGEDVKAGSLVLSKGVTIDSRHMGLLASLGFAEVPVIRKPKVAILSTGDELVAVSETPLSGQVRDCNRPIIASVVKACGCEVVITDHVPDDEMSLHRAIGNAVETADLVILSGGSSAGEKDLTQKVINQFGTDQEAPCVFIHGLAMKPGKPTIVGAIYQKPIIGIPGHPAACYMTLKALVEPFVGHLTDQQPKSLEGVKCISNFQLYAASGRDVYQLVTLSKSTEAGDYLADIVLGKSGMVSAMAQANAYVIVPMQHEGVLKGDSLLAYLL